MGVKCQEGMGLPCVSSGDSAGHVICAVVNRVQKPAGPYLCGRCEAAHHGGGYHAASLVPAPPPLPLPVPAAASGPGPSPEGRSHPVQEN